MEAVDYFSNHKLKLRFPWSLYHRPIVDELSRAIAEAHGGRILNVGSGPFFELGELEARGARFTLCDIDPRAISLARTLHGSALDGADVIHAGRPLPYPDGAFDAVVSMDVVEHLEDPVPWLEDVLRVLAPGGLLFLTTPNYASRSLRVIENTVLEAIARLQGFSRKDLHPTKLNPDSLRGVIHRAGGRVSQVKPLGLGWVLAAYARK
jgi:2-polyprenyl-6-hydroxyphenyl methylase/3-demethylubiquinone-9 3-methyltransferase